MCTFGVYFDLARAAEEAHSVRIMACVCIHIVWVCWIHPTEAHAVYSWCDGGALQNTNRFMFSKFSVDSTAMFILCLIESVVIVKAARLLKANRGFGSHIHMQSVYANDKFANFTYETYSPHNIEAVFVNILDYMHPVLLQLKQTVINECNLFRYRKYYPFQPRALQIIVYSQVNVRFRGELLGMPWST